MVRAKLQYEDEQKFLVERKYGKQSEIGDEIQAREEVIEVENRCFTGVKPD